MIYWFLVIILNSLDCHHNLSSRNLKYPCGICGKTVTWTRTVCSITYTDCETVSGGLYRNEYSDIQFIRELGNDLVLLQIRCTSFEHCLLRRHRKLRTIFSMWHPLPSDLSSSPKQDHTILSYEQREIRILVVDIKSLKAMKEPFWSILEHINPDVVLMMESWLCPSIIERGISQLKYTFAARKNKSKLLLWRSGRHH